MYLLQLIILSICPSLLLCAESLYFKDKSIDAFIVSFQVKETLKLDSLIVIGEFRETTLEPHKVVLLKDQNYLNIPSHSKLEVQEYFSESIAKKGVDTLLFLIDENLQRGVYHIEVSAKSMGVAVDTQETESCNYIGYDFYNFKIKMGDEYYNADGRPKIYLFGHEEKLAEYEDWAYEYTPLGKSVNDNLSLTDMDGDDDIDILLDGRILYNHDMQYEDEIIDSSFNFATYLEFEKNKPVFILGNLSDTSSFSVYRYEGAFKKIGQTFFIPKKVTHVRSGLSKIGENVLYFGFVDEIQMYDVRNGEFHHLGTEYGSNINSFEILKDDSSVRLSLIDYGDDGGFDETKKLARYHNYSGSVDYYPAATDITVQLPETDLEIYEWDELASIEEIAFGEIKYLYPILLPNGDKGVVVSYDNPCAGLELFKRDGSTMIPVTNSFGLERKSGCRTLLVDFIDDDLYQDIISIDYFGSVSLFLSNSSKDRNDKVSLTELSTDYSVVTLRDKNQPSTPILHYNWSHHFSRLTGRSNYHLDKDEFIINDQLYRVEYSEIDNSQILIDSGDRLEEEQPIFNGELVEDVLLINSEIPIRSIIVTDVSGRKLYAKNNIKKSEVKISNLPLACKALVVIVNNRFSYTFYRSN